MFQINPKNDTFQRLKRRPGIAAVILLIAFFLPVFAVGAFAEKSTEAERRIFLPFVSKPPLILDTGDLLITEVLFRPDASQGDVEWFEIYNAGMTAVDLSHYKIGDEESLGGSEGMLRFPIGAVIWPGEVILVVEDAQIFESVFGFLPAYEFKESGSVVPEMRKYSAWTGGSINLTNAGDELLLLDRYDSLADSVSWGSSNWAFDPDVPAVAAGQSIERYPVEPDTDTADDWRPVDNPGPGVIDLAPVPTPTPSATVGPSPTPSLGSLLISEILYDPIGTEPGSEWIEIYNPMQADLDLAGFKIGDEETQGASEGMFIFPEGAVAAAGEFIVIANDAVEFFSNYGFLPSYELAGSNELVPDLLKYPEWAGGSISLSNSGDELLLLDLHNNLVDAVSWEGSTWAFTPSVDGVSAGQSIERISPELDTNTALDWRSQPQPIPGVGNRVLFSTPVP